MLTFQGNKIYRILFDETIRRVWAVLVRQGKKKESSGKIKEEEDVEEIHIWVFPKLELSVINVNGDLKNEQLWCISNVINFRTSSSRCDVAGWLFLPLQGVKPALGGSHARVWKGKYAISLT